MPPPGNAALTRRVKAGGKKDRAEIMALKVSRAGVGLDRRPPTSFRPACGRSSVLAISMRFRRRAGELGLEVVSAGVRADILPDGTEPEKAAEAKDSV